MTDGSSAPERPVLQQLQGTTAGFVTRLLAYLLDVVILTAIIAFGGWVALLLDDLFKDAGFDLPTSSAAVFTALTVWVIGGYYVISWSLTGRTVGKAVLGVKVVMPNGRPPSIGRSFLRLFGYAVSTLALFAGYFWILVDENRKGWHDHIAGTWVVYDWNRRKKGEIYETMVDS